MRKYPLALVLLIILTIPAGTSSAIENFSVADLDGRWSMHALGVYDVRGLYYYGTLTLEGGLIVGDKGGAQGSAVADFTGGGLNMGTTGEVQGIVKGRSSLGSITIYVNKGWMGSDKNQITFIGSDHTGMILLVTLVRIQ